VPVRGDTAGAALVERWLERRARLGLNGSHPVFCMQFGDPLAASYIRVLVPRLGRKASIAKRVHAHGLRHTPAAELRDEDVHVGIISKQLGHVSIATTARYLDHIAPCAVVEVMQGWAWPGM
jgi:integrase